ncbi:reverse transcriptase domain-containing protein [Tanacetum coccineum]
MVGVDHAGYTDRFHELAKLVPHLVTPKAKRVTSSPQWYLAKAGEKRKERDEAKDVNQSGNHLALKGIVVGTYSLNNLYAIVLFDSGADFSFISTKFAPLLNEKPSIANPGYVIEVVVSDIQEMDKNEAKWTKPSTGMKRARKTKAEGVPIFYGPTRAHFNGPGQPIKGYTY